MDDLISRQAAIDYCYQLINVEHEQGSDEMNYGQERVNQTETILHHLEFMPSAQPEPLTDKEQRIFLAAMRRERKVCTYAHEPCEVPLTKVCDESVRKVKGALWTT